MSLLGYIFGSDEEQQRADSLDAQLRAANERDYGPGGRIYERLADEQGPAAAIVAYKDVQGHLDTEEEQSRDIAGQVEGEFYQSLKDSSSGARKLVGGVVGSILGAVPLSVWLLLGVALFVYMGGWVWLKGRLLR